MPSEYAKRRETPRVPRLDWQGELDSHLADLDSRLTHPRRRATDVDRPAPPELAEVEMTSELLDEIAWRVAEEIRRTAPEAPAAAARSAAPPAARNDEPPPPVLRPGKVLLIRFRVPLLPWPFRLLQRRRQRREHPLTTARIRA